MNTNQAHRDYGLIIGLLAGTALGAGLMLWLAPRSGSELRERVSRTARALAETAAERQQQLSTKVSGVVDDLTRKGQDVRDEVADAVARGAHEVERVAVAARSDRASSAVKSAR
ncbi:MAG: YtxH domain-containing protein [Vicinamibacterales bacterium]|nr:YtxH domain-containing protein [Vicinamibacterales bacterium]